MSSRFASRQRGAIGLMAALTLGMALVFGLLVADSGRLYMEQRKLQRVVDMAALEAAGQSATCNGSGVDATATASVAANRNGFNPAREHRFQVSCGTVATGAASLRTFTENNSKSEAIRVIAEREVPTSVAVALVNLIGTNNIPATTVLQARAIATPPLPPLAALTIRSNLLSVDSNRSAVLNALFSGLLGGAVNISAAGWESLLNANVSVLDLIKQLNITAADFEQLVGTNVKVSDLVDAMVKVASNNQASALVDTSLKNVLTASANAGKIQLGDILNVQNGTGEAGLDADVQLFQLLQATAQLAGKTRGAVVDLKALNIPGLVNIGLKLGIVEPEQVSAIGNPALAKLNPTGPNEIYVRTAQVRLMLSIQLPALDLVNGVSSALNGLVSPLAGALNGLLHLNLAQTIGSVLCLLGAGCDMIDPKVLPNKSIDIDVEVASGSSRVTNYTCTPDKTLTAQTQTAAVALKVGSIANPNAAFSSSAAPAVTPLPLVDIGIITCHKILGLGSCDTASRRPFAGGGLGIKIDTTVGGTNAVSQNLLFNPPASMLKNIGQPPVYLSVSNGAIVAGLKNTLTGVQVQAYESPSPNLLGDLLNVAASILADVNATLGALVTGLLGPIVDPLLDNVLKLLGIQVNQFEVGANLQCGGRPTLVL